jgi:hypothetical protein
VVTGPPRIFFATIEVKYLIVYVLRHYQLSASSPSPRYIGLNFVCCLSVTTCCAQCALEFLGCPAVMRLGYDPRKGLMQCIRRNRLVPKLIVNEVPRATRDDTAGVEKLLKLMGDQDEGHAVVQSFVNTIHPTVRDKDMRPLENLKLGYRCAH